jgi:hypothetical protein
MTFATFCARLALAVTATIWLGAPTLSRAATRDYELLTGLANFEEIESIFFNGYFTFDPATLPEPTESDVNLFILASNPLAGTYKQIAAAETEPNVVFAAGGPDGDTLIVEFEYNFGAVWPVDPMIGPYDPVTAVMIETPDGETYMSVGTITGDAVPVPEPPTLFLLAGTLGLFLLIRATRWRSVAAVAG